MPADPARRRLVLALVVALAVCGGAAGIVIGAAGGDDGGGSSAMPPPGRATPKEHISFLAKLVPPPAERRRARGPAFPKTVADLARRLPLERKVAQVFLYGFRGTDTGAEIFGRLRRVDLGGIVLGLQNYVNATQLGGLAGQATAVARQRRHVPPWVFASQEGGELNSFPDLPPSAAPADMRSAAEARTQAQASAKTLRSIGINAVLGPVVDVGGSETGSVLGSRVYSDDPKEVAAYAGASVRGYRAEHVFSSASHFPGLGASDQSTQDGPATVGLGLDDLRQRDLIPFKAAIDAGVPGITVSSALYPFSDFTVPASLSSEVNTDLLRSDMRFRGVGITDDLADPAITTLESIPDAAVKAFRTGADMVYISGDAGDQQAAYVAMLRAVRRKKITRARLNAAVGRILLAKQGYGLIR